MKKHRILLFVFLLTTCFISQIYARLNETKTKLIERYGEPVKSISPNSDHWKEMTNYIIGSKCYRWHHEPGEGDYFGDPADWEYLEFDMPYVNDQKIIVKAVIHKGICLQILYDADSDVFDVASYHTLIENNGYSSNDKTRYQPIYEKINNQPCRVGEGMRHYAQFVSKRWYELRDEWIKELEIRSKAIKEQQEKNAVEKAKEKKNFLDKL